ncbi:MAG: hypothetical protein GEU75_16245 [Dehalococcoidia bacterium]|nr:hypothetical protein [Dehalococcoidia bacterium]
MEQQPASPVSLVFLKLMVLAAVLYLIVVIQLSPPNPSRETAVPISQVAGVTQTSAASISSTSGTMALDEVIDREIATLRQALPRARLLANVHIGPSENYAVLGLVPQNGRLEVAGRNETADWIAIVFTPGSTFHGWVPASSVTGIKEVQALQIVPMTPLRPRQ